MQEKIHILIVEDESIVALEIQERLKGLGYLVAGMAVSGEEAIQKADRTRPELVLMDIRLQGEMDGITAAEKIQSRLDIPVVFLTAYADDETLRRAKIQAPFGYILKPFEERDLHITIEMALAQHAMERRIKEKERWLATTLRSIGEAVIATDTEGRVTFLNPVAENLTGWARNEALGRNAADVFKVRGNGRDPAEADPIREALREGRIVAKDNDSILLSKDGSQHPISDSAAPIRDEKGNVTGVVLVFSDITERKRAAEELKIRLRRIQRQQAAIVSLATHQAVVSGEFQQAVQQITETVAEAMEVERVSVWLLSDEHKELVCKDLFERSSRRHSQGIVLRAEDCPSYFQAMARCRAVDAHDALSDPRTLEFTKDYLNPNGIVSMLGASIRVSGDLVGVVCHEQVGEPRQWSAEEIAFAGEVADQVAQAIQNARRKQDETALRKSYEKVKRLLEQTVDVLASTVETRDPYTAGHQRRVALLACAIAEEMGLSEDQIEGLRMAALIHDIGKIYVPAEILSKPGTINKTERKLIETHPQIGENILRTVEFPWPVAQIVLQHHERCDGSGFPQGLTGEKILLEAKILGVADVVEAMSSHRPYRASRGISKALQTISEKKGVLFDAQVVDACLRLFYKRGFQFQ